MDGKMEWDIETSYLLFEQANLISLEFVKKSNRIPWWFLLDRPRQGKEPSMHRFIFSCTYENECHLRFLHSKEHQ